MIWKLRIEFVLILLFKGVQLASYLLEICVLSSPQSDSSHIASEL